MIPRTPLPSVSIRRSRSVIVAVFSVVAEAVGIINAKQRAGECGCFSESHEECFVDLSLGIDEDPAEEEYKPADGEHGSCEELDESGFHKLRVES